MADVFNFYVNDDRTIEYTMPEPIMLEDYRVAEWQFRIPKVLNGVDMSLWAWWLVYVNAKDEKYSAPLVLTDDEDDPDSYSVATYTVDYGMTGAVGKVSFALESINADSGGTILNEWHTKTYTTKVTHTLQGNQAEYAETEADIISALIAEIQTKTDQIIGGATPLAVATVEEMVNTEKVYLLTTDRNWYYHNGSEWVSGGLYAAGVQYTDDGDGNITVIIAGGQ